MNHLDQPYITGLARKAALEDSDAFAELYAATYQQQYTFAYEYLGDAYLARDALQQTYIQALQTLDSLRDPGLFLPWLAHISYQVCLRIHLEQEGRDASPSRLFTLIGGQEYSFRQILHLPFTEADVLSLRYFDRMPVRRIARLLHIRNTAVSRYLVQGERRLRDILNG